MTYQQEPWPYAAKFISQHEFVQGYIAYWSGSLAAIPIGCLLCDGTNGTPDIVNSFLLPAGTTAVDVTGGNLNHTHPFTGDGHIHDANPYDSELSEGIFGNIPYLTSNATGTTDNGSSLPPYHALLPVQFGEMLNLWVTFRFAMDQSQKPPLNQWLCTVDDVPMDVVRSDWQDAWTLLLIIPDIHELPDRVLLEYTGPNDTLKIVWGKQWEPTGPILSLDITT